MDSAPGPHKVCAEHDGCLAAALTQLPHTGNVAAIPLSFYMELIKPYTPDKNLEYIILHIPNQQQRYVTHISR